MFKKGMFLILALIMVVGLYGCGKKAKLTPIDEASIAEAIEVVKGQNSLVRDAYASVKEDTVSFAIVVNPATDKETAKDLGDSFARALSSIVARGTDLETPSKDYYGELFDQYDFLVAVGENADNLIVSGAKVKGGRKITW